MKSQKIIITIALIAGLAASAFADEKKEETISMDKVPAIVKNALTKYASESDVKSVEKGDQDGKKVFEFTIEKDGKKYELALSPKGKYMGTEEDIEISAMPEAAQTALKAQAAGAKLSGGEKAEDKDHKITYEADIEKDGKKSEVAVDADGKLVSTESAKEEGKEDKD